MQILRTARRYLRQLCANNTSFVYLGRNKCFVLNLLYFLGGLIDSSGNQWEAACASHEPATRKCKLIQNNTTNCRFMFRFLRDPVTRVKINVLSRVENSIMSTQSGETGAINDDNRSIHSGNIEEVHNVPIQVIIRPIPPVLDELKVQSLMRTIQVNSVWF